MIFTEPYSWKRCNAIAEVGVLDLNVTFVPLFSETIEASIINAKSVDTEYHVLSSECDSQCRFHLRSLKCIASTGDCNLGDPFKISLEINEKKTSGRNVLSIDVFVSNSIKDCTTNEIIPTSNTSLDIVNIHDSSFNDFNVFETGLEHIMIQGIIITSGDELRYITHGSDDIGICFHGCDTIPRNPQTMTRRKGSYIRFHCKRNRIILNPSRWIENYKESNGIGVKVFGYPLDSKCIIDKSSPITAETFISLRDSRNQENTYSISIMFLMAIVAFLSFICFVPCIKVQKTRRKTIR